jgi:hypothetical protein
MNRRNLLKIALGTPVIVSQGLYGKRSGIPLERQKGADMGLIGAPNHAWSIGDNNSGRLSCDHEGRWYNTPEDEDRTFGLVPSVSP